jgi:hypothetical protein
VVPTLQRGMAFGPFELVAPIRHGGMGEVWHAVRVGEGGWRKDVALKMMRPNLADEARFVAQFRQEAQISALLAHPNVVGVSDFGCEGGMFWLELERVDGDDLYQLLERAPGGFPLPIALFVVTEILKALEHALTKPRPDGRPLGIIHRDLKPSNVLCAREGHVKLADFGLAKLLSGGAGTILGFRGTIGYRAPEQFHGHDASPASDVFSVGLVLWELLTGAPLFGASSEGERMRLIEACVVPPLPPLTPAAPEGLDGVLRRLLARTPEERYADAGQALAAILALPLPRPATSYDLQRFLAQLGGAREGQGAVPPPAPSAVGSPAGPPSPSPPTSGGTPAGALRPPVPFGRTLLRSPAMFKAGPASDASRAPRPPTSPPAPEPRLAPQLVVPPVQPSSSRVASGPGPTASAVGSAPPSAAGSPPPSRPPPPLSVVPPPLVVAPPPISATPASPPRASVPPPLVGVAAPLSTLEAPNLEELGRSLSPVQPPVERAPQVPLVAAFAPSPHAALLRPPPPVDAPPVLPHSPLLSSSVPSRPPAPGGAPPARFNSPGSPPASLASPPAPFAPLSPVPARAPLLSPVSPAPRKGGVAPRSAGSPSPAPRRPSPRPGARPVPNAPTMAALVDGLPPPAEREPLHKRPVVLIGAAAVVLLSVVGLVVAMTSRSDDQRPPTPADVSTTPAPAAPSTLVMPPPLAPEAPAVVPALPGAAAESGTPPLAVVQVVTDPPDARLSVNGVAVAGSSPFLIRDVDPRWSVRIRVEAAGFETFDEEVTVPAAKASLPVKLLPAKARGKGAR